MAGSFVTLKMKRKDIDDVNDDFSDFSLSSPARKIRRLDAELPPILEEEELEIPLACKHPMVSENVSQGGSGPVIEELPALPQNDERAIVLFKPMNTPLLHSPPNYSVSVSPDLVSGLKNQVLWSGHSNSIDTKDESSRQDKSPVAGDDCLAVVPWVPSEFPSTTAMAIAETYGSNMEADVTDAVMMDIEDNTSINGSNPGTGLAGVNVNESLHQWQQQHCMIAQPPQQPSAPIIWYR